MAAEGPGHDDRTRAAFTEISALGVEEQRVNVIVGIPSPLPSLGDGYVEVVRGLGEGQQVVLPPSDRIHDGVEVTRYENTR